MNRLSRRRFVSIAGLGVLSTLAPITITGCTDTSSSEPAATSDPHTVVVTMPASCEPEAGFDPTIGWGSGEHGHNPLIQTTLFDTDLELNIIPKLATEWQVSDDGITWHITIKGDEMFSDKTPLTTEDVIFTLQTVMTNEKSELDLSMIKELVKVDDTHFDIVLNQPYLPILHALANLGIVPKHAYSPTYGTMPIGSGPYQLSIWEKGQQVVFEVNPNHPQADKIVVQKLVVLFMDEEASAAAAAAGKVDVAYTAAAKAGTPPQNFTLLRCESVDSRGISLPCIPAGSTRSDKEGSYPAGNNVTADPALRQAMNMAINRKQLVEHALQGYGTPAYSVSDNPQWSNEALKVYGDGDVTAANDHLDKAGWKLIDGIRVKDGIKAEFNLWFNSKDSVRQAIAVEFAEQMKALGIKVNPQGAGWDDIMPKKFSEPVVWGWGSNSPVDFNHLFDSESPSNFACYTNDKVNTYLKEALAQKELAKACELYKKAQWDGSTGFGPQGDAPWVWCANIEHLYFVRDGLKVAKQKLHPHGHGWAVVNNIDTWSRA